MKKQLYKFYIDFGRMGELEGLFIAEEDDFNAVIGESVWFGEALGKHSDVEETMTIDMFEIIDIPADTLELLEEKIGSTLSGYNPVEMYKEYKEEMNI